MAEERPKPGAIAQESKTAAIAAVDAMFLDRARKALEVAGADSIGFLFDHPCESPVELAKRLKGGGSALGLLMAIYADASARGMTREVAKELFLREIIDQFPFGWSFDEDVRPFVRLGGWNSALCKCIGDSTVGEIARKIVHHIAIDHPPPHGWKPQNSNDPLIDELFDRYWPIDAP